MIIIIIIIIIYISIKKVIKFFNIFLFIIIIIYIIYLQLSLKYQPEKGSKMGDMIKYVNKAYEILSNSEKR